MSTYYSLEKIPFQIGNEYGAKVTRLGQLAACNTDSIILNELGKVICKVLMRVAHVVGFQQAFIDLRRDLIPLRHLRTELTELHQADNNIISISLHYPQRGIKTKQNHTQSLGGHIMVTSQANNRNNCLALHPLEQL